MFLIVFDVSFNPFFGQALNTFPIHPSTLLFSDVRQLRHSENHQAFMLVRKGELKPVIFDGHRDESLLPPARQAFAYIAQCYAGPSADVSIEPIWGLAPKQYDRWSCGHRIILSLKYLLQSPELFSAVDGRYSTPLDEIKVPDKALSLLELERLCQEGLGQNKSFLSRRNPMSQSRGQLAGLRQHRKEFPLRLLIQLFPSRNRWKANCLHCPRSK